jgi:hypothetical protein
MKKGLLPKEKATGPIPLLAVNCGGCNTGQIPPKRKTPASGEGLLLSVRL